MLGSVAALFVRRDSVYKSLGVDSWDADRNALLWPGGSPIIAHPPCRSWGQLSHMAKPEEGEKELAIWAIGLIRRWGGVLEHPRASKLWKELRLPLGEERDEFGGFTMSVDQSWWGHRARKTTLLYICGCERNEVPAIPLNFTPPTHVISSEIRKGQPGWKPRVTKREREATPSDFAKWLIELAMKCKPSY